jgi:predicted Zn finger-like uncharacterized protein
MSESKGCPSCEAVGFVVTTSILIKGGSSRRSFQCSACDHRWTVGDGVFAPQQRISQADRSEPVPARGFGRTKP